MWEQQGDGRRRRQAATLTHKFFPSWPYHAVLFLWACIFASSASRPEPTASCYSTRRLATNLRNWLSLDPRLHIEDWHCARLPISFLSRVYIISQRHVFRLSPMWRAFAYLHRRVLLSHCLHKWNIRLCQRSRCSTSFPSIMSFKVREQLKNLTPVLKCIEIWLLYAPYLKTFCTIL